MWNRYCQNHRISLPNFLSFAWFDALDFNRQPCSNNKMYDNAVFADRFLYQLNVFGILVLIGLSRLCHAHIAFETDGANIIPKFCRISDCLYDLIRLNSVVCHVQEQDVWWCFFDDPFRYQLTYVWSVCIDRVILTPWNSYCTYISI